MREGEGPDGGDGGRPVDERRGGKPGGVLVAGCGYVGLPAALALRARGSRVWGLRRTASAFPGGVEAIRADLGDPARIPELPAVSRLVYAVSSDERSPEGYEAAYVSGLRNLLRALPSPPERLLYVSSTAVYGDAGGAWVDETTPEDPEDFRGEILLRGEALAGDAAPVAVRLRLGGIYGPGRSRLVDRVRSGEARCPANGPVWSNRIHREDAAGAVVHLLEHPDPNAVYLGVDDEPSELCEVYRFVAGLLGVPGPRPDPELRSGRVNKRCSNARLHASGYALRFPSFREGYRALIEEEGR